MVSAVAHLHFIGQKDSFADFFIVSDRLTVREHFPNLQGFHFNRHTGLEKLFVQPPVFTVNGTLHIPAQELLPQGNNTHVELRLIATRVSFRENRVLSTDVSTAIIELKDERFNGMALSVPVDGEGALIVALQYRACKAGNGVLYPSGDRRYMAADIISITVPADQVPITAALIGKASRKRLAFRRPVKPGIPASSSPPPQIPESPHGSSSPPLQTAQGIPGSPGPQGPPGSRPEATS